MALTKVWTQKKWYTSDNGVDDAIEKIETYNNAYIVVSSFDGTKSKVNFMISVFEDASKENLVTRQVYEFNHKATNGAANILKQAYLYLKTLPEFAGAVDC